MVGDRGRYRSQSWHRVSGPASLLDILPTIGAIEGFEVPQHEGMSLLDHVSEGIIPVRELAFESLYPAIGWGSLPSSDYWIKVDKPGSQALRHLFMTSKVIRDNCTTSIRKRWQMKPVRCSPFSKKLDAPLPGDLNADTALDSGNQSDERVQDRYWDRISPGRNVPFDSKRIER